ncbi:MAG: DUF4416 family protein [Candidatus Marinimicrobia bacterium]|nr:DUF4416 family protein [Candidatus Neomarinimicrobiota bacterium]
MGKTEKAPKALLFQAATVNDVRLFDAIEKLLLRYHGKMVLTYGPYLFDDFSTYYAPEMGKGLQKKFYFFEVPVSLENVYRYKLGSQMMESLFVRNGKRRLNLDPGYLTLYQFSLLTTKAFSHRSYLAEGIYTECTLIAQGNDFVPLPWTYPDYKTPEALALFRDMKKVLKRRLRD